MLKILSHKYSRDIRAVGIIHDQATFEFVRDHDWGVLKGLWLIAVNCIAAYCFAGEVWEKTAGVGESTFRFRNTFAEAPGFFSVHFELSDSHPDYPVNNGFTAPEGTYAKNATDPWKWVLIGGHSQTQTFVGGCAAGIVIQHNFGREATGFIWKTANGDVFTLLEFNNSENAITILSAIPETFSVSYR